MLKTTRTSRALASTAAIGLALGLAGCSLFGGDSGDKADAKTDTKKEQLAAVGELVTDECTLGPGKVTANGTVTADTSGAILVVVSWLESDDPLSKNLGGASQRLEKVVADAEEPTKWKVSATLPDDVKAGFCDVKAFPAHK